MRNGERTFFLALDEELLCERHEALVVSELVGEGVEGDLDVLDERHGGDEQLGDVDDALDALRRGWRPYPSTLDSLLDGENVCCRCVRSRRDLLGGDAPDHVADLLVFFGNLVKQWVVLG